MRGDRPYARRRYNVHYRFTPHARGSTRLWKDEFSWRRVYPACAGIDPDMSSPGLSPHCLPRMRGDRPMDNLGLSCCYRFTPHARGSTGTTPKRAARPVVYPACAGIDLAPFLAERGFSGLPRMRGDRPGFCRYSRGRRMFTPHARGSTGRPSADCLPG